MTDEAGVSEELEALRATERHHQLELAGKRRRESALVVAGDFNGDLADAACADLLRLTGLAPHSTDPFVSHVSHRGDLMGCDFVLTRPPQAPAGGRDLACRDVALHGTVEQMRAREWPSDHSLLVVRLGGRIEGTS